MGKEVREGPQRRRGCSIVLRFRIELLKRKG